MPVAPPTSAIGRCPARWKRRSIITRHQVADVHAVGRRIEADVERPRLLGEPAGRGPDRSFGGSVRASEISEDVVACVRASS